MLQSRRLARPFHVWLLSRVYMWCKEHSMLCTCLSMLPGSPGDMPSLTHALIGTLGARELGRLRKQEERMHRRIGLLIMALAAVIILNAGPAKAQTPSVAAGGVEDSDPFGGKPAPALSATPANPPNAGACSFCFTCGGIWPMYSGSLSTTSAAVERGRYCDSAYGTDGFTTSFNDTHPYLCCKPF